MSCDFDQANPFLYKHKPELAAKGTPRQRSKFPLHHFLQESAFQIVSVHFILSTKSPISQQCWFSADENYSIRLFGRFFYLLLQLRSNTRLLVLSSFTWRFVAF